MKIRATNGFTLVEFVVAIVFIGVVLGPFLLFVARIHDLNSAVGQQSRREAWRSFTDQAVAAGIDPTFAPGLANAANVAVPALSPLPTRQIDVTPVPGLPRIVPLQVVVDPTVAEPRMAGAGFQLGAGGAVAPRGTPTAPLVPVVMPMPVVTPADGMIVAISSLAPGAAGAPYTMQIQAAASAGANVSLVLNQPHAVAQGAGIAQQTVTAVDLLNRVSGDAWSEYPGNPANGDQAVTLNDGRTRWLVTRSDGRLQIYEPSSTTIFGYQLGLGAPVLTDGTTEASTGSTLAFDYAGFYAIESGARALKIDFPASTKAVFGTRWGNQTIGFQCTFAGAAGPFSGDLQSFFSATALPLWADSNAISATPVVPAGAVAEAGTWTVTRVKTALGVPELASLADAGGFFSPGELDFTAPRGPDGSPLGRLSFENGSDVSTGPSLSISVTP